MGALLFEFLGTFFLVLTIALSQNPIAIGVVLTCLVYAGGAVSGAHYNPAVTLAFLLKKKIKHSVAFQYMIMQLTGATLAAVAAESLFSKSLTVAPSPSVSWITAVLAEIIFSCLLVSVILHVAQSKKTHNNQYFGVAIGGTVLASILTIGTISGAALNPAVGVSPLLRNLITNSGSFEPSLFFLYIIGPVLGAFIATSIFQVTQEEY